MAYDDDALYVRLVCWETDTSGLVTKEEAADRFDVRQDSVMIGLDVPRAYDTFLFIAVNAAGKVQAVDVGRNEVMAVWYAQKPTDLDLGATSVVRVEKDRWEVDVRIPRKALRLEGDLIGTISGLGLTRTRNAGLERAESSMWGPGIIPIAPQEFGWARFE